METITIGGVDEHAFRHSVEDMLRLGDVDAAVADLRVLLEPYVAPRGLLPSRFLELTAAEVEVTGWERLAARIANHDRPQFPISAIGVVLADARVLGGPGPQAGRLAPYLKTYYFCDDAYPFTNAAREDLLDGYTRDGFGWQGDYQATDVTLSIKGLDDLHGAIIALEDRLLDSAAPDEDELRAGTIGACYLAALIHQALRDTIRRQGLPRPLCVLAACDGVYPFFDAPVVGWDEGSAPEAAPVPDWAGELDDAELDSEELALAGEGSLLALAPRLRAKPMALEIDENDALEAARFALDAAAQRLAMDDDNALKGLFHGVPMVALADDHDEAARPDEEAFVAEVLDRAGIGPGLEAVNGAGGQAPGGAEAGAGTAGMEAEAERGSEPAAASEPWDWRAEAREAFRQAEVANAFPTGRSLRDRFREVPEERAIPLAERLAALRAQVETTVRRALRRGRLRVGLAVASMMEWRRR